jgi:hypothetical protein
MSLKIMHYTSKSAQRFKPRSRWLTTSLYGTSMIINTQAATSVAHTRLPQSPLSPNHNHRVLGSHLYTT